MGMIQPLMSYQFKFMNRIMGRVRNTFKKRFVCPICDYNGPFDDFYPETGIRKHARCPECKAFERHRIQYLVLNKLLNEINASELTMLHFAPEPFFRDFLSGRFGRYETADLFMDGVDYKADLQDLPFDDQSYDFVFASHVMEHIPDDNKAISEVKRILKPGGIAILPVPIIADRTVEYPRPNPFESDHVRAPGLDYFERYRSKFTKVDLIDSESFSCKYQLYVYEDRSRWPSEKSPLRPPMPGKKHIDIVPVCYA